MRTSEERILELHERMSLMQSRKRHNKYIVQCAAAGTACLAIMVLLGFVIAGAPVHSMPVRPDGISASIFADHAVLGYIMIALLAFCLGVSFTIFCYRLRKHTEERND